MCICYCCCCFAGLLLHTSLARGELHFLQCNHFILNVPCNAHHRHAHNKDDDDDDAAAIEKRNNKNKKQKLYVLSSIAIVGYAHQVPEREGKSQRGVRGS